MYISILDAKHIKIAFTLKLNHDIKLKEQQTMYMLYNS